VVAKPDRWLIAGMLRSPPHDDEAAALRFRRSEIGLYNLETIVA
jgi:hypothetical protein